MKKNVKKNKKRDMKSSTLILAILMIIIVVILIKSKAPKVEIEIAQPVQEPPIEEPEEIIKEELEEIAEKPEAEKEENTIEIKRDSFYPKEKTIQKNTEIKWIKKDSRTYKIGCYLKGTRVIQSPDLKEGDFFTYTFLKKGEYTCITTPYGLRSTITVESLQPLLSPTADVIRSLDENIKSVSLAAISLIAIVALLFFIYSRKRQ